MKNVLLKKPYNLKKKIGKMIANLDLGKILPEYLLLTMGSAILAVNFDVFLAPFNIAPGGVSGAAIIIPEFTGWPKGLTMLILTLPMLVIGFFYLGRFRFLVRAFYVTLVYSLGVDGLAIVLPAGVTKDLLLNAIYGGIIGGIGIGLIYRGGTSPAGTSVISRVIQLKTIVSDADPKAFVVIAQGHQTRGGMLRKTVRMANNP
jgi:uncharacterized membrane-anchored protein YitT (DUF2179 family)